MLFLFCPHFVRDYLLFLGRCQFFDAELNFSADCLLPCSTFFTMSFLVIDMAIYSPTEMHFLSKIFDFSADSHSVGKRDGMPCDGCPFFFNKTPNPLFYCPYALRAHFTKCLNLQTFFPRPPRCKTVALAKRHSYMGMGTLCTSKSPKYMVIRTLSTCKTTPIYEHGDILHWQNGPHIWP